MTQCAKCGKKVKILYFIWKHKESSPEFYDKLLCNSCYNELYYATETEALCEHLRLLGLDATNLKLKKPKYLGYPETGNVIGAVRVANRNIDLVELEYFSIQYSEYSSSTYYRCDYLVHALVEGLEDKLKAELRPVRKSLLSREVVAYNWVGRELALVFSSDANLGDMLHRMKNTVPLRLEIKPYIKHQCVRIRQKGGYSSPEAAFPTIETLEAYDRIAQHIRSIANIHP